MKNLKSLLFIVTLFSVLLKGNCQVLMNGDETVLRQIADNILNQTSFQFKGVYNDQLYPSAKEIHDSITVKFENYRTAWNAENGMLNMVLFKLGKFMNETKYTNNVIDYLVFNFENMPVFLKRYNSKDNRSKNNPYKCMADSKELEAYGTIGADVIDAFQKTERDDFKDFIKSSAKYISETQERLADKTLVRKTPLQYTISADDLYMSVPFLVRMGKFTGDKKYYDDAIRQVFNYEKYLWDPFRELFYQCWFSSNKQNGLVHSGISCGLVMMAQVELLNILPGDYPRRDSLVKSLERQIIGLSKYQNKNGLWHTLLDKPDTRENTTSSAMFIYTIAKAINENWVDNRYASIALIGWEELKNRMITPDGKIKSTNANTSIYYDMVSYYKIPETDNDIYGISAVLNAGIEIIKLKQKLGK